MKKKNNTPVIVGIIVVLIIFSFLMFRTSQTAFGNKQSENQFLQYTGPLVDDSGREYRVISYSKIVTIPIQNVNYKFEAEKYACSSGSPCCQTVKVYKDNSLIDTIIEDNGNNLQFKGSYYYDINGKTNLDNSKQQIWFHFDRGMFNNGQCYYTVNSYIMNFPNNSIILDFPESTIKTLNSDINISIPITNNLKIPVKTTLTIKTNYYTSNGIIEKEYIIQKDIPSEGSSIILTIPKQYIENKIEFIPYLDIQYPTTGITGVDNDISSSNTITIPSYINLNQIVGEKITYLVNITEIKKIEINNTTTNPIETPINKINETTPINNENQINNIFQTNTSEKNNNLYIYIIIIIIVGIIFLFFKKYKKFI